ncbi:MAG: phosphotransferase enzyme family protein [Methylohalobius sp. ZOD2]
MSTELSGVHAVAACFDLPSPVEKVEVLGHGLINDTYRVITHPLSGVLQRINRAVFPRPAQVMANLRRLHDHWRDWPLPGLQLPRLIPTRTGKDWIEDGAGGYWRMLEYIDGTTLDKVAIPAVAESLGWSLGRFHRLLAELDSTDWHDTLPGFHVTSLYLDALDRAHGRRQEPVSRELAALLHWIDRQRGWAVGLDRARAERRLPLRIVHGDPKLDNLLFERASDRPLAWIDLDTVMPGLVHHDVGDCLRSVCRVGEGRFDLDTAAAVLRGWYSEAGRFLETEEVRWVPEAIRLLPFELGVRFLTDYLDGNRYFKVTDSEENLRRALEQFELTRDIQRQEASLRALWRSISAAPGK